MLIIQTSSPFMGWPVECECSARAEVARSQLRTDFGVLKFVAQISCWLVLCKSTSSLCRDTVDHP